jgi:hypothetical protein
MLASIAVMSSSLLDAERLGRLLKEYEDCNYHLTIRFERQDLMKEEQDLFALLV